MSYDKGFGLRLIVEDARDFFVGNVFQIPKLSDLPDEFSINIPDEWVESQIHDTCVKEASQNLMSLINGVHLDTLYTWVIARFNAGYSVDDWGLDIRSMLLACVKAGAPRYEDSPFRSDGDRSVFADITKWDLKTIQPKAIEYKAGSAIFIQPSNGMDMFDTIRATLFRLKTPVVIGLRWNFDPQNPSLDKFSLDGYGHAMLVLGWKKDGTLDLRDVTLNSYGRNVGENGRFYISREIINHDCAIFGAGTLIDETPEKVKWHLENKVYLDDQNLLKKTIIAFYFAAIDALKAIIGTLPKQTGVPPYPKGIYELFDAIKRREGWSVGSRSWRNHNPFNARYVGQYKAIGEDRSGVPDRQNGYAIFPDNSTGEQYCLKILWDQCTGKSISYNREAKKLGLSSSSELSLSQYFAIFAPSHDLNDPQKYAEDVAGWTGRNPDTKLKEFTIMEITK